MRRDAGARTASTSSADAISAVEVVDAAHPSFADPTLGVVTGGSFYYIANSQWGAAKPGGQMDPSVTLQDPVVLTLADPR